VLPHWFCLFQADGLEPVPIPAPHVKAANSNEHTSKILPLPLPPPPPPTPLPPSPVPPPHTHLCPYTCMSIQSLVLFCFFFVLGSTFERPSCLMCNPFLVGIKFNSIQFNSTYTQNIHTKFSAREPEPSPLEVRYTLLTTSSMMPSMSMTNLGGHQLPSILHVHSPRGYCLMSVPLMSSYLCSH